MASIVAVNLLAKELYEREIGHGWDDLPWCEMDRWRAMAVDRLEKRAQSHTARERQHSHPH